MSVPGIVGLCAFFVAAISTALANFYANAMIDEINRRRESDDQISSTWFTPAKTLSIYREYRRTYPSGRLNVYSLVAMAVSAIALVVSFLSLRSLIR